MRAPLVRRGARQVSDGPRVANMGRDYKRERGAKQSAHRQGDKGASLYFLYKVHQRRYQAKTVPHILRHRTSHREHRF